MSDPCTALVPRLVRIAAPVALVLACLWSTRVQSQPPVGTKNDRLAALPQSVEPTCERAATPSTREER